MQINFEKHNHFQLWETEVENENPSFESSFLTSLSNSELSRLNKISHLNKRNEYLYSRALIRHALSQAFDKSPDYWNIQEIANCAPVVLNLPSELNYSLSHSNNKISFAVSSFPIGIDIEKRINRKNLLDLAALFMSETELTELHSLSSNVRPLCFYRVWCAKEAYFKALELNSQKSFKANSVTISELKCQASEWHFIDKSDQIYTRIIALKNPE